MKEKIFSSPLYGRILNALSIFLVFIIPSLFMTVSCTKKDLDNTAIDSKSPVVISVVPGNDSLQVKTDARLIVTFDEAIDSSTVNTGNFIVKAGTVSVPGFITYSGKTATFIPAWELLPATVYTITITTGVKDLSGNPLAENYTWSFKTKALPDVTPPAVLSVTPADNALSVATSIKPAVTFNEAVNPSTLNSGTFILQQGSVTIGGTVTCSGASATFTPSAALPANTLFTVTLTKDIKDIAGNPVSAPYTWKFTTAAAADVTPPSVLSTTPAANAISVALNIKPSVTFSEAVNSSTVNSSTFILKQGSTVISGTVSLSGNTAVFTPSSPLAAGLSFTAAITTGVKDLSGNPIASGYTWSFTTTAVSGKSFSADVVPILNLCNTCHTHPWTPSTNASTFYNNLASAGYISSTNPTSGKIYIKLSGGHPPGSTISADQKNTVMTWITEGSKNN